MFQFVYEWVRECRIITDLAPLLYTNIRSSLSSTVIATDASEWGCGMVYVDKVPSTDVVDLVNQISVPGDDPPPVISRFVKEVKWSTALSSPWVNEEHIYVLEVRAVLQACRWMVRRPLSFETNGVRFVVLADSSATVGALTKGRSSSHPLLA